MNRDAISLAEAALSELRWRRYEGAWPSANDAVELVCARWAAAGFWVDHQVRVEAEQALSLWMSIEGPV